VKDLGPSGEQSTGAAGSNRPSWAALVAGAVVWAGLLVGLFAAFQAVGSGLDPADDADQGTILTLFVIGILFAAQIIPAMAGASLFVILDKRLRSLVRPAVTFAAAACAVGLLGTFLYVTLVAGDGTFGVEASSSMVFLYLMCVAADGAVAAGVSYFVARTLEGRRQREA